MYHITIFVHTQVGIIRLAMHEEKTCGFEMEELPYPTLEIIITDKKENDGQMHMFDRADRTICCVKG